MRMIALRSSAVVWEHIDLCNSEKKPLGRLPQDLQHNGAEMDQIITVHLGISELCYYRYPHWYHLAEEVEGDILSLGMFSVYVLYLLTSILFRWFK